MDILGQFLDSRDQSCDWRPVALPPGERLSKFDDWLFRKLSERIDWTWAGDTNAQGRRIHQARNYVERMVLNLWRRGWLLDGSRLAKHILAPIDTVAEYQKRGTIKEFWPYFCATIDRYVGVNSEEIQLESRRAGAAVSQVMSQLTSIMATRQATMPELLAQRAAEPTLRAQTSAHRKKSRSIEPGDEEPTLFNSL